MATAALLVVAPASPVAAAVAAWLAWATASAGGGCGVASAGLVAPAVASLDVGGGACSILFKKLCRWQQQCLVDASDRDFDAVCSVSSFDVLWIKPRISDIYASRRIRSVKCYFGRDTG